MTKVKFKDETESPKSGSLPLRPFQDPFLHVKRVRESRGRKVKDTLLILKLNVLRFWGTSESTGQLTSRNKAPSWLQLQDEGSPTERPLWGSRAQRGPRRKGLCLQASASWDHLRNWGTGWGCERSLDGVGTLF